MTRLRRSRAVAAASALLVVLLAASGCAAAPAAPELSGDGPGLQPSPAGTLSANRPPFVDYLDREGRWVGNGAGPPRTAVFIRRWAVAQGGADGYRTIVLQVLVTTVAQDRARAGAWQRRSGTEVLLVSFRMRTLG